MSFVNISIIMPKTLNCRAVRRIFRFSRGFLFVLNSTIRPMTAPEQSPAITEAKLKAPPRYISVKSTEAAQFGISPSMRL